MASLLEIIADDVSLDLFQGEAFRFYATLQIHDLKNLEARKASFSKTINVPGTPKNIQALKTNLPTGAGVVSTFATSRTPVVAQKCQVLMDGLTIAVNGQLLVTESRSDGIFTCFVMFGNFLFWDTISLDIRFLSWNDLDFTFDQAGYDANSGGTTDIVTALADWYFDESFKSGVDPTSFARDDHILNFSGFHLYVKEIFKRIVEQSGFVFDDSSLLTTVPEYDRLALACPVTQFAIVIDNPDPLNTLVESNGLQLVAGPQNPGTTIEIIAFDTIVNPPPAGIVWSGTPLYEWQFSATFLLFDIALNVQGTYTQPGNGLQTEIRILKNGVAIATRIIGFGDNGIFNITVAATTSAVNGDDFRAEVEVGQRSEIEMLPVLTQFALVETGANLNRDIEVLDFVPAIDKKDFMRNIMSLFNLIMETSGLTNTVTLKSFDDIDGSLEQDLTKNLNLAVKQEFEHAILTYFRINVFKYADNADLRRTDTDAIFIFDDEILEKQGILIESLFGASDNSTVAESRLTLFTPVTNYPVYEFEAEIASGLTTTAGTNQFSVSPSQEFNVGDYIEQTNHDAYQIITRVTDTTGLIAGIFNAPAQVNAAWTRFIYEPPADLTPPRLTEIVDTQGDYRIMTGDRNTTTIINGGKEAIFQDRLLWGGLLNNHYDNLLNALKNPLIVIAWFTFSAAELLALDFLRPVYLQTFNAHFYINKIEQYKAGTKLCRLELIRI